jgi:L-ascorbate metabolism protein UlaG (beta-lactamase superfamily)
MWPDNTVWHLTHSASLLKLGGRVFIFDYFAPYQAGAHGVLSEGTLSPDQLVGETVVVFFSHVHADHYHRSIFEWKKRVPGIRFVVSSDIPDAPAFAHRVGPGVTLDLEEISVKTYPSTDEGVAFSIFMGGKHVYFPGDNAFWNWDGEPDKIYLDEILPRLDPAPIDIAFHVCDARLADLGYGGILLFATQRKPRLLIPIHANGSYELNRKVERELQQIGFAGKFWCIQKPGESIALPEGLRT